MTTVPGLSRGQGLMPGAFGPEDYIGFYANPFEALDDIESAWENREPQVSWSAKNLQDLNTVDFDWHKYDPPSALRKAPNITSQVLLDVLWSSLENVKAGNIKEGREKKEIEEQRQLAESDRGKSKEPYLPVIIPAKNQIESANTESQVLVDPQPDLTAHVTGPVVIAKVDVKANKKRMFALRRFFQRSNERGESSAMGAALGALREVAEEAEHSRASSNHLTKPSPVVEVQTPSECVSCLDDFHPKDVIKVPCHNYCHDCFVRLVSTACQNEQQWPPKCCLNEIPSKTILRFVPANLKKIFEERSKEWELPLGERVYCSDPSCSLWIRPKRINISRRQGVCDRSHQTCTICRGPAHSGEECPQDVDMNLTNQLAEDEGWKRCGTQFCYVCTRRWRTCTCTMEQLQQLKEGAAGRRIERLDKQLAEAEELRLILLQIEEFEREEALKAELLRQEQERLEKERWQRELEERMRQESVRRKDVETKYQELRILLDQLHELQQVLLDVDQEKEAEMMSANIRAAKDDLEKKHDAERSDLETLMLSKMADKVYALDKDSQIRAAEENDIEEAYHERLKAYWGNKKGGEQEIESAMLALRKRMDQKHHAWQQWKTEQLRAYEAKLEDDRTYRGELMYSAKHRLCDSCNEEEAEMTRRMSAEKKWLQVLILEREKLLAEREVQEVEGDADSLFAPDSGDSADGHDATTTMMYME
ncbi:hypothetical protein F66182_1130 [Fusarium sp. NRRL 66182]|nr:hypothetical protein F66182_1130 [Fusarium sp. NRRL 66182]